MTRRFVVVAVALALAACRSYQYESKISDQGGLTPPDQFARYGREQAQAVAIGREFGHAAQGNSPEAWVRQADAAVSYARTLPDVADVQADPQGHRLTVRFKSGWRTGVAPIDDGKRGSETPGLPGAAPRS